MGKVRGRRSRLNQTPPQEPLKMCDEKLPVSYICPSRPGRSGETNHLRCNAIHRIRLTVNSSTAVDLS